MACGRLLVASPHILEVLFLIGYFPKRQQRFEIAESWRSLASRHAIDRDGRTNTPTNTPPALGIGGR